MIAMKSAQSIEIPNSHPCRKVCDDVHYKSQKDALTLPLATQYLHHHCSVC